MAETSKVITVRGLCVYIDIDDRCYHAVFTGDMLDQLIVVKSTSKSVA